MIWTRETTAGRSFTPTSSGSPPLKACCAPCWGSALSSSRSPQVMLHIATVSLKSRAAPAPLSVFESDQFNVSFFVSAIIIMALLGMFNVHRHGAINSAAIVLYALTSCVSGYVSCSFYTQINGQRWVWNIILTSSLFSGEPPASC